jgi:hypothetical protein
MDLCPPTEFLELVAAISPTSCPCGQSVKAKQRAFLEVLFPFSVFPYSAAAFRPRLSWRSHFRPRVFSTPRRFNPLSTYRTCFIPNPLLGLCPSELSSSRVAVRCLQRLSPPGVQAISPSRPSGRLHRRNGFLSLLNQGFENAPDFRGLLYTRVRHLMADGLGRPPARSSLGFLPSRVFSLLGVHRLSPLLPSWVSFLALVASDRPILDPPGYCHR